MVNPVRASGRGQSGSSRTQTVREAMSPPVRRLLPVASQSRSLAKFAAVLDPSRRSVQVRSVTSRARTAESITLPSGRLSNTTTPAASPRTVVMDLRSSSSESVQVRTRCPTSSPTQQVRMVLPEPGMVASTTANGDRVRVNGRRIGVAEQGEVVGAVCWCAPGEVGQEPAEQELPRRGDHARGGAVRDRVELDPAGEVEPGRLVVAGRLQQGAVRAQHRGGDHPGQHRQAGPGPTRQHRRQHRLRGGDFLGVGLPGAGVDSALHHVGVLGQQPGQQGRAQPASPTPAAARPRRRRPRPAPRTPAPGRRGDRR